MEPITVSKVFDASPEKIWNALTDADTMRTWYFPVEGFELKEGSTFTFYENEDSHRFLHRCTITQIDPNRVFEHTWTHPEQSSGTSVLRWEISKEESRTRITLIHRGTETFSDAGPDFSTDNFRMGWNAIVNTGLRNHLNGIKKLIFTKTIDTTPGKIWATLWTPESYTSWTEPYCANSYFSGELKQGNRIHFLSPTGEGMYSDVVYLKEYEIIVFSHIGMMKNRAELPVDEATSQWTGCIESYRLIPAGSGTLLRVEMDVIPDYINFTEKHFPDALDKLKEMAEN